MNSIINSLGLLSASGVLTTVWSVIKALLVLLFMITVHELGHYLVAKIFDFRVNEFSIGMGPAIFKKQKKNGEVFSVRILPLGGYCAFEGEDEDNTDPRAFNNKKPWQRILVLLAGATMNFIFAILIFAISFLGYGQMCMQAFEVQEPDSLTLQSGDVILKLNDKDIYLSTDLISALKGKKQNDLVTAVVMRDGQRVETQIKLAETPTAANLQDYSSIMKSLSIARLTAVSDSVLDEPDALKKGDYLLRYSLTEPSYTTESGGLECKIINGGSEEKVLVDESFYYGENCKRLYGQEDLVSALTELKNGEAGGKLYLFVSRGEDRVILTCVANDKLSAVETSGELLTWAGVKETKSAYRMYSADVRFGFFESLGRSVVYAFKNCSVTLRAMGQILTGKLGVNNLSGTIGTISLTSQYAAMGFRYLLEIAGMIGVSLAVFNLLPIPALDGARAVFVLIEWVRGKPINRKVEGTIHAVGLIALLAFSLCIDLIKCI